MRISTATIFDSGLATITRQQSELLKIQRQIGSGQRILTPADDPVGSARVLNVTQAQSINEQYKLNGDNAKSSLSLVDLTLQNVTNIIQNARSLAIAGGNAAFTDSDRASLAAELQEGFNELLGHANITDGNGQHLFSGFQERTLPFVQTAGGVQYVGDQGNRLLQVSPSRQIAISASGSEVFERIKNGNGVFVTQAAGANTGTGVISPGTVVNSALLTGQSYQITFNVAGTTTTYDVLNTTTGLPVSAGNPYTSGNAIIFDGIQFDIEGVPANGDIFTVTPSTNQSLFRTISDLINVLKASTGTPAAAAKLNNGLNSALSNLDEALDSVLGVRAVIGARLQEIDALQSSAEDLSLHFAQTLSQLQDVDYAKAITQLTQHQVSLEAAQLSFQRIASLSLFNYL